MSKFVLSTKSIVVASMIVLGAVSAGIVAAQAASGDAEKTEIRKKHCGRAAH